VLKKIKIRQENVACRALTDCPENCEQASKTRSYPILMASVGQNDIDMDKVTSDSVEVKNSSNEPVDKKKNVAGKLLDKVCCARQTLIELSTRFHFVHQVKNVYNKFAKWDEEGEEAASPVDDALKQLNENPSAFNGDKLANLQVVERVFDYTDQGKFYICAELIHFMKSALFLQTPQGIYPPQSFASGSRFCSQQSVSGLYRH
jgi:hypothetical protein